MRDRFVTEITEKVVTMLRFLLVLSAVVIAGRGSAIERDGKFNKYLIHTRANYHNPIELDLNVDTTVKALTLEKNTSIIIHGHQGSGSSSLNPLVKNEFLTSEDMDVIIVDWSLYARQSYRDALEAVQSVGESLANVINELVTKEVVSLETLHVVGFDLGAHVAGYAGRALEGKVARITGLNPSKPQGGASFQRLRITDALYVEVFHTDGIGPLAYGIGDAIGDVDFYINGGSGQPGCPLNHWCSHNRSWEVFAATLNHKHLVGNQCGTWLQVTLNNCRGPRLELGGNAHVKYGFGMYRKNTRRTFPF